MENMDKKTHAAYPHLVVSLAPVWIPVNSKVAMPVIWRRIKLCDRMLPDHTHAGNTEMIEAAYSGCSHCFHCLVRSTLPREALAIEPTPSSA